MAAVIVEGARQPVVQAGSRRPAGQFAETAVVSDEIADVDALALVREFAALELAAAICLDQGLGERQQGIGRLAADIEGEPGGLATQRGRQKRLDSIRDRWAALTETSVLSSESWLS